MQGCGCGDEPFTKAGPTGSNANSIAPGLIPKETSLRFAYDVSDTPLAHSTSLATNLTLAEGVSAGYALTRAILRRIFVPEE